jgi:purine-binding chemotaxis protein CheW
MPETEEIAEILEDIQEVTNSENTEKFMIFSILDKLYGFPSRLIGEIALFETVYPLPLMPAYVLGVVNRYSVPYALFDIGLLFYNIPSPRNKMIVMKDSIDRIAFLIDDVTGIADIPHDKLFITDRNSDANDLTEAVIASFNYNKNDVFVLDVSRILTRVTGDILL